jgi:hypothetical protein
MSRTGLSKAALEYEARVALLGVGDPMLEWVETSEQAVHLRRRLTSDEAELVGPVRDIRGSNEARRRLNGVRHLLPVGWNE